MKKYLFTTQDEMENTGLKELKKIDESVKHDSWVDSGIGIIEADEAFIGKVKNNLPIFVRHIHPVDDVILIENNESDLEKLKEYVENNIDKLNISNTFSVQTRLLKGTDWSYTKYMINSSISSNLESKKYIQDTKQPSQVISITAKKNKAYIGISKTRDNLSSWTGGEHRFKVEENQISKAEFKLLEAIDVFNVNMEKYTNALDIGSVANGWTKVLTEYDMTVEAVDSAEISQELLENSKFKHHKMSVQQFLKKELNSKYDIIVNDARMDAIKSVEHMKSIESYLSDRGIAIMTLKLPKEDFGKILNDSIKSIKTAYRILRIKQLFNNKSEVTLLLSKLASEVVANAKKSDKKELNTDTKKNYQKKDFGKKEFGKKDFGKREFGEKNSEKKDFGKKDFGKKEFGKKDFGKKDFGKREFGEKDFKKKDFGKKDFGKKEFGKKDFGKKDFGKKEFGKKDFGKKDFGKKDFGKKDFGARDGGGNKGRGQEGRKNNKAPASFSRGKSGGQHRNTGARGK